MIDETLEKLVRITSMIQRAFRDDEEGAIKCATIIEMFFVKGCPEFKNPIVSSIKSHFEGERKPIYCSSKEEAIEARKMSKRKIIIMKD